ncbi:bacitracin ABC transporter ATP-binding protein [Fictibacillus barbaricus]|uniref:Transposase n=1 Tax=Fictibacillus barbaricus TaxID=182136 RepID=A0ABU1TWR7_9BACL|nr:bacitracin ABC transporter ATP-binding protein [Fictibacillus barbaricus]MDR7071604.1 hypothetical protein [Fictibacillus barbaricus]
MPKEKKPLFSDEYLTELAKQINRQYGFDSLENHIDFDDEDLFLNDDELVDP